MRARAARTLCLPTYPHSSSPPPPLSLSFLFPPSAYLGECIACPVSTSSYIPNFNPDAWDEANWERTDRQCTVLLRLLLRTTIHLIAPLPYHPSHLVCGVLMFRTYLLLSGDAGQCTHPCQHASEATACSTTSHRTVHRKPSPNQPARHPARAMPVRPSFGRRRIARQATSPVLLHQPAISPSPPPYLLPPWRSCPLPRKADSTGPGGRAGREEKPPDSLGPEALARVHVQVSTCDSYLHRFPPLEAQRTLRVLFEALCLLRNAAPSVVGASTLLPSIYA